MAHLDYRTNQATDPETLDDMERFIGMLSPLHRYTLMLMTADAIASEDYPCAEETDLEGSGDKALTCPHCLDTITEVTHLSLDVTATPADFSSTSYDDLIVHHRARGRAPLLTWQCPECLNPISLPPEIPVEHTGAL